MAGRRSPDYGGWAAGINVLSQGIASQHAFNQRLQALGIQNALEGGTLSYDVQSGQFKVATPGIPPAMQAFLGQAGGLSGMKSQVTFNEKGQPSYSFSHDPSVEAARKEQVEADKTRNELNQRELEKGTYPWYERPFVSFPPSNLVRVQFRDGTRRRVSRDHVDRLKSIDPGLQIIQ